MIILDPKGKYSHELLSQSVKNVQEKKISESREFFEQLVSEYPTCGKFWKIYIEQEIKARNFDKVEKLFHRCLIKVLNIDLWRCYLNYIRETKAKTLSTKFREKMAQAYDFSLEKIGLDVASYSIWVDYVNFLKSVEPMDQYAESQKITAIRKVYQKGVMNPMVNVEQFWKDYCAFENQTNVVIAKKMIDDRSREFLNVRRISKEYENMTKYIDKSIASIPPQCNQEENRQVNLWKKYIDWEKGNPLKYEDQTMVAKRVMFAYEQCLLCMSYHPDIWYEAANYLYQTSIQLSEKGNAILSKQFMDETANMYERAISTFMKNNLLLYFAFADFEETRSNYTKVTEIYEKALLNKDIDPTLCYIQYMRFLRRAEGIRSARAIFRRATEDPSCTHHIYTAAAFMEYYCTKDKTLALKIFQLGHKKYGHIPDYVLSYIDYASHLNEDNLSRELFETVLGNDSQLSKDNSFEIWSEYLKFELNVGDLTQICKLEKLKQERLKDEITLLNEYSKDALTYVDRYKYHDLIPLTQIELKSIGYKEPNTITQYIYNQRQLTLASGDAGEPTPLNVVKLEDNEALIESANLNIQSSTKPLFLPDTSKMRPFKPQLQYNVQPQISTTPVAAIELLKRLPPPFIFEGPYVMIEEFMQNFLQINLPDTYQLPTDTYASTKSGFTHSGSGSSLSTSLKRTNIHDDNDDDDDDDNENDDEDSNSQLVQQQLQQQQQQQQTSSRNLIDIYKQRQQNKLIKQS